MIWPGSLMNWVETDETTGLAPDNARLGRMQSTAGAP
jgi:hypothetical protein